MRKFSVITVCLNAENVITETITSVLNQTSKNIEYIVKDGGSKDKTVSIAESYRAAFADKGIPYRILTDPDGGIYEGMNQAIQQTQGQWLVFMNAGDSFANEYVLEKVENSGTLEGADIVYGDRILKNGKRFLYQKPLPLECIRYWFPFGHQSTFTRRELFKENLYSTNYRIASDYRFYLQMYQKGKRFIYVPMAICFFDMSGISLHNDELVYEEMLQILEEMPVRDEEAIQKLKQKQQIMRQNARKKQKHVFLRRFIPKRLRDKRWEWKRRKAGWKTEEEFFGQKKDNP